LPGEIQICMLAFMHQISLLGDAVPRHGGGSHFMRPDRVMRTSVLSPMVGYNPGQDVQMVANAFTTGPQSGMTLSGPGVYRPVLRGLGAPLFPRLRNWWAGVRARAWMRKMQASAPVGFADSSVPGGGVAVQQSAYGPAAGIGPWGGPQRQIHQMVAQAYGRSSNLPPNMQEGIDKTTMMMWRGLRWPWH
jgi:hypothetical protein